MAALEVAISALIKSTVAGTRIELGLYSEWMLQASCTNNMQLRYQNCFIPKQYVHV